MAKAAGSDTADVSLRNVQRRTDGETGGTVFSDLEPLQFSFPGSPEALRVPAHCWGEISFHLRRALALPHETILEAGAALSASREVKFEVEVDSGRAYAFSLFVVKGNEWESEVRLARSGVRHIGT